MLVERNVTSQQSESQHRPWRTLTHISVDHWPQSFGQNTAPHASDGCCDHYLSRSYVHTGTTAYVVSNKHVALSLVNIASWRVLETGDGLLSVLLEISET